MSTVRAEMLLGRRVVDVDGENLGRLEDMIVEVDQGELVIREFHTGLIPWWLPHRHPSGYRIAPEQIDLTKDDRITVNVPRSELRML